MQGESDAGNPNYAIQLRQLFTDLDADVRATAGQAQTVQFFICLTDQQSLEGKYTVFGEVVEGMDVLDKIGQTPVEGDRPKQRIEIQSVVLRAPSPSPAP